MNKMKNILLPIGLVLVIFLVTFIALNIPSYFYERGDKQILEKQKISDYNMAVENEQISYQDKLNIFVDKESVLNVNNTSYTEDEIQKINEDLQKQVTELIQYGWRERILTALEYANEHPEMQRVCNFQVTKITDDKIQSFELGVLVFVNDVDDMWEPAEIFFDMETKKIIYMSVMWSKMVENVEYDDVWQQTIDDNSVYYNWVNYADGEYAFAEATKDGKIVISGRQDYDENNIAVEESFQLEVMDSIALNDGVSLQMTENGTTLVANEDAKFLREDAENYFGRKIDAENGDLYMTNNILLLDPFSVKELDCDLYYDIENEIYSKYQYLFDILIKESESVYSY